MPKFQISDVSGRANLLSEVLQAPDKQAPDLALWAMYEPDYELRVLAMQLWRKIDVAHSKPALIQGLYDANGYVNKGAADALVSYGKKIEGQMIWILEDRGTKGPFYAIQVLRAIGATGAVDKIVPLLRSEDPDLRMMAAESLARLNALSALPHIEAALTNLPKDEQEQEFYKATFSRAIAHLKEIK